MSSAKEQTLILTKDGDAPDAILVKKSKLLVLSGALQGKEFMIDKDVFSIGSGPHNDLVLDDTTVSRRHCEIRLLPDGYVIRDLGSTNGTIVEGVKVSEAFIGPSTEFQLGKTRLVSFPVEEAVEYTLSSREQFGSLLGKSVLMRRVFHLAETYAPTDATILLEGETGTGKDVLAEEIHRHSERKRKPFIVIDCAALARELIESELFGHTKGAFTGADVDRTGAFEHANGGTVFLDEITELSPELQPKLLRVLEKKEIKRLGSNRVRNIDVRIMCATNRQLENEVNAGHFREDLYYRLSVVHIDLPPLRKRKEDIRILAEKFLKDFLGPDAVDRVADFDEAMKVFRRHNWPGNVRELRNLIEIASYSAHTPIRLSHLVSFGRSHQSRASTSSPTYTADRPFKEAKNELISEFEKGYIRDLLSRHNGNVSKAARSAGIERAYLQRLIRKHDLK